MSRTKYQKRNWRAVEAANKNRKRTTGVVKLSKAADQEVELYSTEIAEAIRKQATEGNASAARLLVELAEGAEWVKDPEAVDRVLSVFEMLASNQPPDESGKVNCELNSDPTGELDLPREMADIGPMPGAIVAQNQMPPSAAYVN